MTDGTAHKMDAAEIDTFLREQHTGILSLAAGDDAYAIPVSFAYKSEDGEAIYSRLGFRKGSEKREYLDAVDRVAFVVYDQTEEGWKSVIARGTVTELSESSLDSQILQYINDFQIPYFRVFDRPAEKMEFRIARLDIDELTGIVEGTATGI